MVKDIKQTRKPIRDVNSLVHFIQIAKMTLTFQNKTQKPRQIIKFSLI